MKGLLYIIIGQLCWVMMKQTIAFEEPSTLNFIFVCLLFLIGSGSLCSGIYLYFKENK